MAHESVNAVTARIYATADRSVFPLWWPEDGRCACPDGAACGSPAKHPLTRNGVKDATRDLTAIATWWTRWPLASIGMPANDNGFAILDEDPPKGGTESLRKLRAYMDRKGQPLPDTLTQVTGSGGRHFIYAAPEGGIKGGANVFGPDMPGLDTRGRGGYIVAAPSIHVTGNAYDWIDMFQDPVPWPAILTRLMTPPKPVVAQQRGPRPHIKDGYAAKALDDEVQAVRAAKEGGRNDRLNTAAFNLGQLVASGALNEMVVRRELYSAACAVGLGEREAAGTILSGMRGGLAAPRVGRAA